MAGIEFGFLFAFRAGRPANLLGMAVCLVGLVMVNWKK